MGKLVIFTGSRLLGEELRRLRGLRTLEDIRDLSKSEPLSRRIRSVSLTTLSFVENAKAMPNLETLHALAVIYQVSAQHLLNIIVEERLCKTMTLPDEMRETEAQFRVALREGRWYDALTLAIHGERQATTETQRVAWRANRGSCLYRVGLRAEAVDVLTDSIESPDLPAASRLWTRLNLIEVLIAIGRLTTAEMFATSTVPLAAESGNPVGTGKLLQMRARIHMLFHESGLDTDPRRLREAQHLLGESRRLANPDDAIRLLLIDLETAEAHRLLGNHLVAIRDFKAILASVEGKPPAHDEALASLYLGIALSRHGGQGQARPILEHAASLASREGQHAEAFRAYLELLKLATASGAPDRTRHLTRCKRLLPMVDRQSLPVREFVRFMGEQQ